MWTHKRLFPRSNFNRILFSVEHTGQYIDDAELRHPILSSLPFLFPLGPELRGTAQAEGGLQPLFSAPHRGGNA